MGKFLVILMGLVISACGAMAQVQDKLAGDRTETYVNIEFSPDNKYAIMMEANSSQNATKYKTYLSQVNDKGDLVPASGKGQEIGAVPQFGMPQWGQDKFGAYAVMLDTKGNLVFIRPKGKDKPVIQILADNEKPVEKLKRVFPYPSLNKASGKRFVTYQIRDTRNKVFKQVLVDISIKNPVHNVVYKEPYINGRTPGPIVNFARWLKGSHKLYYGAYEPGCNLPKSSVCPSQVKMLEMKSGKVASNQYVTNDDHHKIDAFPYMDGSVIKLFAGLDLTEKGGEYKYNSKSKKFVLKKTMDLRFGQTDLKQPGGAQSMEPFMWKNELYVVYQVIDMGLGIVSPVANSFPGEIWIYKSKSEKTCRVSMRDYPNNPAHPEKRARVDAEPVISKDGKLAKLYYHSSPQIPGDGDLIFDLRKITLNGKANFDDYCGF